MKQTVRFYSPVLKSDGSGDIIEVGDTASLILKDESLKDVTVSDISEDGKTLSWELTSDGIPRKEDVISIEGDHQLAVADSNLHDDPWDHLSNPPLS